MIVTLKKENQRGFVLVVVLWLIAVLTIFATTFSLSTRGGIRLVKTEINSVMERAYLDAGVELAAFNSSVENPSNRWRADGRVYQKSIGKTVLRIRLYDQSGRIDINKSDPSILLGLLQQFVHDPNDARRIIEQITSRRQQNFEGKTGAPAAKLHKTRSPSANNAVLKYMDVSQLQYERGMTREIYQNILPFVTVHSKDGRINPLTAPRRVLMAIPTMSQFHVDSVLTARRMQPIDKGLIERLPSSARKWITDMGGPAIKVLVDVETPMGHQSQFVSAIILPFSDKGTPFHILRRHVIFDPPELRKDLL